MTTKLHLYRRIRNSKRLRNELEQLVSLLFSLQEKVIPFSHHPEARRAISGMHEAYIKANERLKRVEEHLKKCGDDESS